MDKIISGKQLDEERALYGISNTQIENCQFDGPADGESALKECKNIKVSDCYFNLRYPFWHTTHAVIQNCKMTQLCRAALWYDQDVCVENSELCGIKAFRECSEIEMKSCKVSSPEVFWKCEGVKIESSFIEGEYPFFECEKVQINDVKLIGKYSFQYVKNMTISNSDFDTKDAFWHSKNVTIIDSLVRGEYLGWYSENLKLVRCKIIGTQPLCYCKGLVLEDCTMEDTDLSFERSEVTATIKGKIDSVKNPLCGSIQADEIGELLIEKEYVNEKDTVILCDKILCRK